MITHQKTDSLSVYLTNTWILIASYQLVKHEAKISNTKSVHSHNSQVKPTTHMPIWLPARKLAQPIIHHFLAFFNIWISVLTFPKNNNFLTPYHHFLPTVCKQITYCTLTAVVVVFNQYHLPVLLSCNPFICLSHSHSFQSTYGPRSKKIFFSISVIFFLQCTHVIEDKPISI